MKIEMLHKYNNEVFTSIPANDILWDDLTNNVVDLPIIQERKDGAIASGTMKVMLQRKMPLINEYFKITIGNAERYFIGNSKSSKYLPKQDVYFHDVELLDGIAVLSNFMVGSKAFSTTGRNVKDYHKLRIASHLAYEYRGAFSKTSNEVIIRFDNELIFNQEKEYFFGAGTTLLDVVNEVMKTYNRVPRVRFENEFTTDGTIIFVEDTEYRHTNIPVIIIDSEEVSSTINYDLDNSKLESVEYNQNWENYCKDLVIEASNVIDRDVPLKLVSVTPRALNDTFKLTKDTARIILPTKCERITSIKLRGKIKAESGRIYLNNQIRSDIESYYQEQGITVPNQINLKNLKTRLESGWLQHLCDILEPYGLDNAFWYLELYPDTDTTTPYISANSDSSTVGDSSGAFNFIDNCLPSQVYAALPPNEQTKCCYYDNGGNSIEGINGYYKNDFINKYILGETSYPMIYYLAHDYIGSYINQNDSNDAITYNFQVRPASTNIFDYLFDIEYIAITNPIIKQGKTIDPLNEVKYQPVSKSYSMGANFIDYNKLATSMIETCNQSGDVELTLNVVTDDIITTNKKIIYDDVEWYITSLIAEYKRKAPINYVLNLNRSYSKVAESIGIDSQYNETKLPLNMIIERPVEAYTNKLEEFDLSLPYYARITFYKATTDKASIGTDNGELMLTFTVPCAILEKDGIIKAYVEFEDEYSVGRVAINDPLFNVINVNVYQEQYAAYVDENGEVLKAYIEIGTISSMTKQQSLYLPYTHADLNFIPKTATTTKTIYKDVREKLSFTIDIK